MSEDTLRFAQCLRGHPALIVLLPNTWRYDRDRGWHDERGRRVKKEDVMIRLEERIITLYSFYPTKEEVTYIHDELLMPLYSEDALSRFLHTYLYPDPDGSILLDAIWETWSRWPHRTTEPLPALLNRMSARRLRMANDALLGWSWRRPAAPRLPVDVGKNVKLTKKQQRARKDYAEAVRLGIAVPGNMEKSYVALKKWRRANAMPPCGSNTRGHR